jgi:hypothetical protein
VVWDGPPITKGPCAVAPDSGLPALLPVSIYDAPVDILFFPGLAIAQASK